MAWDHILIGTLTLLQGLPTLWGLVNLFSQQACTGICHMTLDPWQVSYPMQVPYPFIVTVPYVSFLPYRCCVIQLKPQGHQLFL